MLDFFEERPEWPEQSEGSSRKRYLSDMCWERGLSAGFGLRSDMIFNVITLATVLRTDYGGLAWKQGGQ